MPVVIRFRWGRAEVTRRGYLTRGFRRWLATGYSDHPEQFTLTTANGLTYPVRVNSPTVIWITAIGGSS